MVLSPWYIKKNFTSTLTMISSLPIEIWEEIVKYSSPEDVSNLRQTCRLINEISLELLWRKVFIFAGKGCVENTALRYRITDEIAELLGRHMGHIRVLTVDIGGGIGTYYVQVGGKTVPQYREVGVSDCKSLSKILSLLWNKASELTDVNIDIQDVSYLEPFVRKWVDICTSPLRNCSPTVELYYDCRINSDCFLPGLHSVEDALSAGRELAQKPVSQFHISLSLGHEAPNLNLFKELGRYIVDLEVFGSCRAIGIVIERLIYCTQLKGLALHFEPEDALERNYVCRLPDSVESVSVHAYNKISLTVIGDNVSSLDVGGEAKVHAKMPMLRSISFENLAENDYVDHFMSFVSQSYFFESMRLYPVSDKNIHRLSKAFEKVHDKLEVYPDADQNIASFFSVLFKAFSPSMKFKTLMISMRHREELVHVESLVKRLPQLESLFIETYSKDISFPPELVKKVHIGLYEVRLDQIRLRLIN